MEALREKARANHPEVLPVIRENVKTENRVTLPYYSKYEYTALLGTRAQQLADGAKPLISVDKFNASDPHFVWKVAEREILEQKLPYIIRRRIPGGGEEFWSATELTRIW